MENAPFKVGQKAISLSGFKKVRKLWPFKYPRKGDTVTITSVTHRKKDNNWFVTIAESDCPALWAKCFAPIQEQRIRIERVAVSETLREKAVEIAAVETN